MTLFRRKKYTHVEITPLTCERTFGIIVEPITETVIQLKGGSSSYVSI